MNFAISVLFTLAYKLRGQISSIVYWFRRCAVFLNTYNGGSGWRIMNRQVKIKGEYNLAATLARRQQDIRSTRNSVLQQWTSPFRMFLWWNNNHHNHFAVPRMPPPLLQML
jgi:hypothetical protein